MEAFARQHGMSSQRLWWWRKRLEGERSVRLAPLIPVSVTAHTAAVEVVVDEVRVAVAVPEAVSPAWIAELVDGLRRSRG